VIVVKEVAQVSGVRIAKLTQAFCSYFPLFPDLPPELG